MNIIDAIIKPISPTWALERVRARNVLAAYESVKPTRTRKHPKDNSSGNTLTAMATETLRGQARHLDQNHDICRGILNNLVNYTVGAKGIGIESQVMNKDGTVDAEFNKQIAKLFKDWSRKPETTQQLSWASTQRMVCRTWLRDGEALSKSVAGAVSGLNHGTKVPFSIELLEADHIADVSNDASVIQGIEVNAWGQPRFYHLHDQHPSERTHFKFNTRKVSAGVIDHIKFTDRFKQLRGVSVFASAISRLNDLKDYEESERIAAKISASMAAYIKKGSPDSYLANRESEDDEDRDFSLSAGMIFDNLAPGEDVGTIQSNRPSALLEYYRNAMIKAISSGTSSGFSSNAKTYDGTYSAQRQELVEQWIHYAVLSSEFIQQFVEPTYIRFIKVAIASGVLKVPAHIDRDTLFDADFLTPSMPWIDPKKEAEGFEKLLSLKITSPQKVIRARGDNPQEILDQVGTWEEELKKRGLQLVIVERGNSPPPEDDDSDTTKEAA